MRNLFIISTLLLSFFLNAQNKTEDYFMIEKHRFLKPVKYLLFNSQEDQVSKTNDISYFHIGNERFQFKHAKHRVDTCKNSNFAKLQFENINNLLHDEQAFIEKKIKELNLWDIRALYLDPQVEFHPYFKIIIIEKNDNQIIKYEVDWDYTSSRGLKEKDIPEI